MKEGRIKILQLFRQVLHGIRVLLYFVTVFTLTILIRWLLLKYLTQNCFNKCFIVRINKHCHSEVFAQKIIQIPLIDQQRMAKQNFMTQMAKQMIMQQLQCTNLHGFRKSNFKAFRLSKLQPSENAYKMEQLSPLQSF